VEKFFGIEELRNWNKWISAKSVNPVFLLFCLVLVGTWGVPSFSEAQVLDHIDIVPEEDTEEIHIVFNTRVLYKSHSPTKKSNRLQIYLEFPQIPPTQRLRRQQVAASPRSKNVPKFSVLFPAQATGRTRSLAIRFSKTVKYTVRVKYHQGSSIVIISLAVTKPPSLESKKVPPQLIPRQPPKNIPQAPTLPQGASVQTQADTLMKQAQAALDQEQYEQATKMFNLLLNLPPNAHSQLAQELVGVAREKSGEIRKARLEYELYLKLYPESEGAAHVQKRLAGLGKKQPTDKKLRKAKKRGPRKIKEFSFFGTLTEFYFGGFSESKTVQDVGGGKTTIRNSTQDQSFLLTTADLTGRFRFNQYDNKFVVRGSYGRDFKDMRDMNDPRLRAIFFEQTRKESYFFRIGRQPGNAGGILDLRFDGAWFRYNLAPRFALNLVGGIPRPFILDPGRSADDPREFRLSKDRYLTGINLDFGPIQDVWSGNVYFMNQMVHQLVDRRAIGTEIRYFDNGTNGFLLVDYDVYHSALNILNFNSTIVTDNQTSFNLLVDYRRSPFLQTTNALLANGPDAVGTALDTLSKAEFRRLTDELSAKSQLYLIGVTHPVTSTWQLGGDVRFNKVGPSAALLQQSTDTTSPFTDLNSSLFDLPGSGNTWTFTLQAIGTDIVWDNHTFVANTSYIHNRDFDGQSLSFSSLARIQNKWQIDSLINFFHQTSFTNTKLYRISPSIRVDYRLRADIALEGLFGIGQTWTDSPDQMDSLLREFFFFGIRWEK